MSVSLSLPLLISAVPLHYLDDGKIEGQRGLVTAWFSDGGITSNLPLHFFDTTLPRRPTFGINLLDADPRYPDGDTYLAPAAARRPVVVNPKPGRVEAFRRVLPAGTPILNWGCKDRAGDPV